MPEFYEALEQLEGLRSLGLNLNSNGIPNYSYNKFGDIIKNS